jgi:hypothetical protein
MARKRLTGLALSSRAHFVQKPLNQSFSPEEEESIAHIENAQTAVRTLPFINGLARTGSRLTAANAAYQPMKGIRVIERVTKFNPGRGSQKRGQAATFRSLCTWQENGNHAETPAAIADALINGRTHFFVLPWAKAAETHKDGASFRFGQGLFNGWLPGIARNQIPFVKPSLDAFPRKPASQLLHSGLIGTAMRKKDVERHLGAPLPVRQSWRRPSVSILDNRDLLVTLFHTSQGGPDRVMSSP